MRFLRPPLWLMFIIAVLKGSSAMAFEDAPAMSEMKGKWVGTLDQFSHDTYGAFAMIMMVEKVSGDEFRGTIDWPDNNDNRTAMRGYIKNGTLIFTETDHIRGDDVVLDGLYVAKFTAATTIAGDWMDPKFTVYPAGPNYGTPGASFTLHKQ